MIYMMTSLLSGMSTSPLMSSLMLVATIILFIPMNLGSTLFIWKLYFISLIFLSGVLAIITWFSSLSQASFYSYSLFMSFIVVMAFMPSESYTNYKNLSNLTELYLNMAMVCIIVLSLTYFLFLLSFMLKSSFLLRNT